jgi:hypothetical protein
MPATTPRLGLLKPTDGADFDVWGAMLNRNFDILDTVSPMAIGDASPSSVPGGALWFDSVGLQLYVRYADADSQQWVPATNVAAISADMPFLPLSGGADTVIGIVVPVGGSIQAAIDALPSTGGMVSLLPNIAYTLTAGVSTTKPNVTLTAPGWGTVIQRAASFTTGVLVSLGGAGSTIENVTIDGNNVVPSNYSGFSEVAVGGANCTVRNCQIINSRGTVNLTLGGDNSKALFNTITAPGVNLGLETGYGIWAITGATVLIEGNTITGTCIDGIGFDGPGSRVVNNRVSGCHCYVANSGGQIVYYSTNGTRMALIEGNHIGPGGPAANGFEISGQHCLLVGNTVDGVAGYGVHLAPNTGVVSIVDGIIRNCGSAGPGLIDGILIEANVSDVVIQGMRITDTQTTPTMRDAIHVNAGTGGRFLFTDNVLAPNGHAAISDEGTGTGRVITNNTGLDDILAVVPIGGTITLPANPSIVMSGNGTVTAITGVLWEGRQLTMYGAGATVTFQASATIGNTVTCMPEVPHLALWVGGKLHIGN